MTRSRFDVPGGGTHSMWGAKLCLFPHGSFLRYCWWFKDLSDRQGCLVSLVHPYPMRLEHQWFSSGLKPSVDSIRIPGEHWCTLVFDHSTCAKIYNPHFSCLCLAIFGKWWDSMTFSFYGFLTDDLYKITASNGYSMLLQFGTKFSWTDTSRWVVYPNRFF